MHFNVAFIKQLIMARQKNQSKNAYLSVCVCVCRILCLWRQINTNGMRAATALGAYELCTL